jgi:hypothetical protein
MIVAENDDFALQSSDRRFNDNPVPGRSTIRSAGYELWRRLGA